MNTDTDNSRKLHYLYPSNKWIVNAVSKQFFDESIKLPIGSHFEKLYFKVVDVSEGKKNTRKVYYFSDPETAEKWTKIKLDNNLKEKWHEEERQLRKELSANEREM